MNNWYNRIVNQPVQQAQPTGFQNPMQQAQYIANAMRDPVAFVREQFPDVPENIRNNPDAVLQYLTQTRGNQFAQQVQQISGMRRR